MLAFEDALKIIMESAAPGPEEALPLAKALGRFLTRDVLSGVTLPQYNAAFKDGFAVRHAETGGAAPDAPVTFKIAAESFAGGAFQAGDFAPGTACKITTGAYVPQAFDSIAPWEDCRLRGDEVMLTAALKQGQNVTPAGQELNAGETLLAQGLKLTPAGIGLAAAGGHAKLWVGRMPRVGIISTGDELVLPGKPLKNGQIYSSNQFQLKTQLISMGCPAHAVIIKDDYQATLKGVEALAAKCDLLVSSGGSADSEKDFMGRVLSVLEWRLLAEKINIRPGHTLKYGLLGGKPFFVLPGTPSGTEICFNIFVAPLLLKMAGAAKPAQPVVFAKLLNRLKGTRQNKNSVAQAVLTFEQSGPVLNPVPKNCGRIKSIAHKNALVIVPQEGYDAGMIVEAILV